MGVNVHQRRPFLQAASLWVGGFLLPRGGVLAAEKPDGQKTVFHRLRIVGYNVHNYRLEPFWDELTGKSSPAKSNLERKAMAELLAKLKPDILGLSEVGDEASLIDLQQKMAEAGHPLPFREYLAASDPARHLAVLARVPITARNHVPVPKFRLQGVERTVARGIFDITLDAGNQFTLRLLGAHLKSRRDMTDADQEEVRRNEAKLLREHIDSVFAAGGDQNVLLFGDLNDTRDSAALRAITQMEQATRRLTPLPLADSAGNRWTYHYEPADEYSRIDFLLASEHLLPLVDAKESGVYSGKDWRAASDHRPIYVTLRPSRLKKVP